MSKTALITGLTGQDGSYLAELLLAKGYRVVGHIRDRSGGLKSSQHLRDQVEVCSFPIDQPAAWLDCLWEYRPDEIYHLAAASFVPESWKSPQLVQATNVASTIHLLDAMLMAAPEARLFYASSSSIFGVPSESPQTEQTPWRANNPYGVSKVAAHSLVQCYRQQHGLFASCGILFNHESPRRPLQFVTRKITSAAAAIRLGIQSRLQLGRLDIQRDWGYAGDFVDAMWRSLQIDHPTDFILGTGRLVPLHYLVEIAFDCVGLRWADFVSSEVGLVRPDEATALVADPTLARDLFGWEPTTSLEQMIDMMVRSDWELLAGKPRSQAA
jgi:GDPmannose 4,6-dehydratase